jgi:ClpP class serine protease
LHINSPGGDVAGCFDLADAIYAARGTKPIWAILNESAYSAAYAIASAADKIAVPRTGGTGSIGCITLHADITGMLKDAGVRVTTVQYGARKSDGYPTSPMRGAALAGAQAIIDQMGELFVRTVARNRGLAHSTVRDFEAGIFLGRDGVAAGLADAVMSPDEAFLALMQESRISTGAMVRRIPMQNLS